MIEMTQTEKNTKILLVICPMWDTTVPHLGLSYLKSYLKYKGITVDILDINIEIYAASRPEIKALWKMENHRTWNDAKIFGERILPNFDKCINAYVDYVL